MSAPQPQHPADRLVEAVDSAQAPVCVGLDPVIERLPDSLRPDVGSGRLNAENAEQCANAIEKFTVSVLDAIQQHAPCVKFQSACFERYRSAGVAALHRCITEARRRGLQVILDAKRGDIGISATHYAAASFDAWDKGDGFADWLTINAYFGADGMEPFVSNQHGAFALVRTSNPSSESIQREALAEGTTIAEHMARAVAVFGEPFVGESGYSALGAVVAATWPSESESLRDCMPQQIFLVPGYGAQGGTVDDILPCFHSDGRGAIVTASRSVIYAFEPKDSQWTHSVADAGGAFAEEVGCAVGLRR